LEKVQSEWTYVPRWSHDPETGNPCKEKEKEEAKRLVSFFHERWLESKKNGAEMHVYHYNHTERSLMTNLTTDTNHSSHIVDIFGQMLGGTLASEDLNHRELLDELIAAGVFVDLLAVVRNSLQAGLESYSLKLMEKLAGFDRQHVEEAPVASEQGQSSSSAGTSVSQGVSDGSGAVLRYELYANHELYGEERDEGHLEEIAKYNKEDVDATQALHQWLLVKRREAKHLPDETQPISHDSQRVSESWVDERISILRDKILTQVSS